MYKQRRLKKNIFIYLKSKACTYIKGDENLRIGMQNILKISHLDMTMILCIKQLLKCLL